VDGSDEFDVTAQVEDSARGTVSMTVGEVLVAEAGASASSPAAEETTAPAFPAGALLVVFVVALLGRVAGPLGRD
jgi:hypothetical protein